MPEQPRFKLINTSKSGEIRDERIYTCKTFNINA